MGRLYKVVEIPELSRRVNIYDHDQADPVLRPVIDGLRVLSRQAGGKMVYRPLEGVLLGVWNPRIHGRTPPELHEAQSVRSSYAYTKRRD